MTKDTDGRSDKHKMMMKKKRNFSRLGGSGLSLDAFANAKSKNNQYNPAIIKKQREFHKNAKNVKKFRKMIKRENQPNDPSSAQRVIENSDETERDKDKVERRRRKKDSAFSLEELYKKQNEVKEKERREREAVLRIKKEEIEKAEARRKATREKMFKKTRKGQPVMKYRIENLLETIKAADYNKS